MFLIFQSSFQSFLWKFNFHIFLLHSIFRNCPFRVPINSYLTFLTSKNTRATFTWFTHRLFPANINTWYSPGQPCKTIFPAFLAIYFCVGLLFRKIYLLTIRILSNFASHDDLYINNLYEIRYGVNLIVFRAINWCSIAHLPRGLIIDLFMKIGSINKARFSIARFDSLKEMRVISTLMDAWNLASGRINYKYRRNKELSVGTELAKDWRIHMARL